MESLKVKYYLKDNNVFPIIGENDQEFNFYFCTIMDLLNSNYESSDQYNILYEIERLKFLFYMNNGHSSDEILLLFYQMYDRLSELGNKNGFSEYYRQRDAFHDVQRKRKKS